MLFVALRMIALERGLPIVANAWGKVKMFAQVVAVSILIIGKKLLGSWGLEIGQVALWVALVLTLVSMVVYFWQNRSVLAGETE